MRQGRKSWLVALAALAATTVLAPPAFAVETSEPVEINSFSGAFLAARVAEVDNDLDSAISFYKRALAFDPDNEVLQQSLLITLLSSGRFDEALFREAKDKGQPQMGATRFTARTVIHEFIYTMPGKSLVFSVEVDSPERIVFLPVPEWVIENIWQGSIDGSFHFERDAQRLVEDLQRETTETQNEKWFGPQAAKRRE